MAQSLKARQSGRSSKRNNTRRTASSSRALADRNYGIKVEDPVLAFARKVAKHPFFHDLLFVVDRTATSSEKCRFVHKDMTLCQELSDQWRGHPQYGGAVSGIPNIHARIVSMFSLVLALTEGGDESVQKLEKDLLECTTAFAQLGCLLAILDGMSHLEPAFKAHKTGSGPNRFGSEKPSELVFKDLDPYNWTLLETLGKAPRLRAEARALAKMSPDQRHLRFSHKEG